MSAPVITVENLGKSYRIGRRQHRPKTVREALSRAVGAPFAYLAEHLRNPTESEILWALRDVSFGVNRGEVLGIIGRNGAGKSTLLKILSRITDPTEGRATIRGRVNSLLEVGTGFHPELTGRENIYMNAAMHGMRRAEIDRKMDEIIDFAEVEKFIETPVKRYSSGMYTRLAFAVAAHLEPDILLVDEVLAVGDLSFQKKCLGKMESVSKEGRTVLFVSHQMAAISNLCSRLLLLEDGRVKKDGPTAEVMPLYIQSAAASQGEHVWSDPASAPGDEVVRLLEVRVMSEGTTGGDVAIDKEIVVEMVYDVLKAGVQLMSAIYVTTAYGVGVFSALNAPSACLREDEWFLKPRPVGRYRARCVIPPNFLNDGIYRITPILLSEALHTHVNANEAVEFTVHETGSMRKEFQATWLGVVRPRMLWVTKNEGTEVR
jgi:lipopolysaccharide transport system ATP-binding protein